MVLDDPSNPSPVRHQGSVVVLSITVDEARTLAALLARVPDGDPQFIDAMVGMLTAAAASVETETDDSGPADSMMFSSSAAAAAVVTQAAAIADEARADVQMAVALETGLMDMPSAAARAATDAADVARIASAMATARAGEAVELSVARAEIERSPSADAASIAQAILAEQTAVEAAAVARAVAASTTAAALTAAASTTAAAPTAAADAAATGQGDAAASEPADAEPDDDGRRDLNAAARAVVEGLYKLHVKDTDQ